MVWQSCLRHTKRWMLLVLFSCLEFSENLGAVNDKQSERFHQDIQSMKERYQRAWNENLTGDFYWMLYHNDPIHTGKQKFYAKHLLIFIRTCIDCRTKWCPN